MSETIYKNLRALVVDDFDSIRASIIAMLEGFGISQVEAVESGEAAIERCRAQRYDVILCDYDLGAGKNGQQVLEELRHRQLMERSTLFVVVSAEASKDVVLATYDCAPDDYLMKPVSALVLKRRLDRLLSRRERLLPAYDALEAGDAARAVALLTELSLTEARVAPVARRLLGELFLSQGELGKAEKLYTRVMEGQPTDWARLGLAKVRQARGELDLAGQWLQTLVGDNPLYLPAYDALAANCEQRQNVKEMQEAVYRSAAMSPRSILRQKRLAEIAERNGDWATCLRALRAILRIGHLSCHSSAQHNFDFARAAVVNIEKSLEPAQPLGDEALAVLQQARDQFALTQVQVLQATLLEGHACAVIGDSARAEDLLAHFLTADESSEWPLQVEICRLAALVAIGRRARAEELAPLLAERFQHDQQALELLDTYLPEPVSDSNRDWVAKLNREGIALYESGDFDLALLRFREAQDVFPKHVGIQLNIVQALIGKMRAQSGDDDLLEQTQGAIARSSELIPADHPQYQRLHRLQQMAAMFLATTGQE